MKDKTIRGFLMGMGLLGKQPGGESDTIVLTLEDEGLFVRMNVMEEIVYLKDKVKTLEAGMDLLLKYKKPRGDKTV